MSSVAGSARSVRISHPPAAAPRRQRMKPLAASKHEASALLRVGSSVFSLTADQSPGGTTASPSSSAWSSPASSEASIPMSSSDISASAFASPPLQQQRRARPRPPLPHHEEQRPQRQQPLQHPQHSQRSAPAPLTETQIVKKSVAERRQPLVKVTPPTRALLQAPAARQSPAGVKIGSEGEGSSSSATENHQGRRGEAAKRPSPATVAAARGTAAVNAPPLRQPAQYGRGSIETRVSTVVAASSIRPAVQPAPPAAAAQKLSARAASFHPKARSPPRHRRESNDAAAPSESPPAAGTLTPPERPTSPDEELALPLAPEIAPEIAPEMALPELIPSVSAGERCQRVSEEEEEEALSPRPAPIIFAGACIKHGVMWRGSYPRTLVISQGLISTVDPRANKPTNAWEAPRDVFKVEVWTKERTGHPCTTVEGPEAKVLFLFVAPWPSAPEAFAQRIVLSMGSHTERALAALSAVGVPIMRKGC
jgi:hypothetical protein